MQKDVAWAAWTSGWTGADTSHRVFRTMYRGWTLSPSRSRGPDGEWPRPQDDWTTETVRSPKAQVKHTEHRCPAWSEKAPSSPALSGGRHVHPSLHSVLEEKIVSRCPQHVGGCN